MIGLICGLGLMGWVFALILGSALLQYVQASIHVDRVAAGRKSKSEGAE